MPHVILRHPSPAAAYPALMAFCTAEALSWSDAKDVEGAAARDESGASAIAIDLWRCVTDYADQARALGQTDFPYNLDICVYLGLVPDDSHNGTRQSYHATCILSSWRTGRAMDRIQAALDRGASLRLPIAKDRETRKPIRFASFSPTAGQITLDRSIATVHFDNGKRAGRIHGGFAQYSGMEAVAAALETGEAYGHAPKPDLIKLYGIRASAKDATRPHTTEIPAPV